MRDGYDAAVRKLIISAGDLGITSQRSHGIFQCFEHGVVTTAGLIANGNHSDLAARHARERGLPIGLHFNLTEGSALTRAADIGTLLTTDGYFLGRETFERTLAEGGIDAMQVERELRSQIEWCLQHYGLPTHVDSHHQIHVQPFIAKLLVPILDRYDISFIRIPSEPVSPFGFEIPEQRKEQIRSVSVMAERARTLFAAHGFKFNDHFRGMALLGHASQRNLRHIIGKLPEGVTELMVHPGSANPSGDSFERDPQRLTELNMLLNPDTAQELAERKIELCSYAELF